MIFVKCKWCGEKFTAKKSRIKLGYARFCSRKCWFMYKKIKYCQLKKCPVCNKEFYVKKSETKKHKKDIFYCSRKCFLKYREKTECICKNCGKKFLSIPYRIKSGKAKFCSRVCVASYYQRNGIKKSTSIEIALEKELIKKGIKFQKQYPIYQAKTIPDFFITPNICIYADGDYWHSIKEQRIKDTQQNFILIFLGYKVYRFWEHDILKNAKKCINKIKEIKNVN